ncbi:MAG: hypothetical protein L0214_02875 [candidate division NC10 bacterium]|nr:hypothetical protein [candidate division NC10 bacterium]
MPYLYHTEDGLIQGFSRERSDISLGDLCTPISFEAYEMLCALPTGFRVDRSTGRLESHLVTDHEDWIRWIPVVLNHRLVDGEYVPILREPTPFEEALARKAAARRREAPRS